MNCPKCNSQNTEGSRFCNNCGYQFDQDTTCAHCGKVNQPGTKYCEDCGKAIGNYDLPESKYSQSNTEVESSKRRTYRGQAGRLNSAAATVVQLFRSEGLDMQKIQNPGEVIIQGRKPPAWYKKVLGLDVAATVKLRVEGNDLVSEIGGAPWMDKAAGFGIGVFVFWPVLLTAGWGAYLQRVLFKRIDETLKTHLGY